LIHLDDMVHQALIDDSQRISILQEMTTFIRHVCQMHQTPP